MRHFAALLMRNMVTLAGAAVTTASAMLIAGLFLMELTGSQQGPYLGLLTFVALPAVFVAGLLLIPIGLWVEKRRKRRSLARGESAPSLPVFDLNQERTRTMLLVFFVLTSVNFVILGVSSYKGVEVMDSTSFCGKACHSVMEPEYTTYQRSPHSRVACVSCHIGPGADWFVRSKLSGSWQLVSVSMNLYPRPIPTPVHNLRPARETCEQCHWPSKFVGDRLKVITHHAEDEKNTPHKTVLLLHVGGQQATTSRGIHWHVDPRVRIRYRSDPGRESISDVELTGPDGQVTTFTKPGGAAGSLEGAAATTSPDRAPKIAKSEEDEGWRIMDCVDCHNRPTHIYRMPEDELDASLDSGRIDASLPFIRREALAALKANYTSHEQAKETMASRIRSFYSKNYPEAASTRASAIDGAAQ